MYRIDVCATALLQRFSLMFLFITAQALPRVVVSGTYSMRSETPRLDPEIQELTTYVWHCATKRNVTVETCLRKNPGIPMSVSLVGVDFSHTHTHKHLGFSSVPGCSLDHFRRLCVGRVYTRVPPLAGEMNGKIGRGEFVTR